jgi:hypothetical protein
VDLEDAPIELVVLVDLVVVAVQAVTLERAVDDPLGEAQVGQDALEQHDAVAGLQPFALAGAADDRVPHGAPAARGRVEAVPGVVPAVATCAQGGGEAAIGGVEVQPSRLGAAVVHVGMHQVRRHGNETECWHSDQLRVGPDGEGQLPFQHVEGVGVLAVDVEVGPPLPGGIARPGDRQLAMRGEQDDLPPPFLGDRLTVSEAHVAQC